VGGSRLTLGIDDGGAIGGGRSKFSGREGRAVPGTVLSGIRPSGNRPPGTGPSGTGPPSTGPSGNGPSGTGPSDTGPSGNRLSGNRRSGTRPTTGTNVGFVCGWSSSAGDAGMSKKLTCEVGGEELSSTSITEAVKSLVGILYDSL
jgi:hypothetical protein